MAVMEAGNDHPDNKAHSSDGDGQPVGFAVPGWTARPRAERITLTGRTCRLEPLDPDRHAHDLFTANADDASGRMWTYLPVGPFADEPSYRTWTEWAAASEDPLFFAIADTSSGNRDQYAPLPLGEGQGVGASRRVSAPQIASVPSGLGQGQGVGASQPGVGVAVGIGSYLRIDPANGVIEVGHLQFSPRMQRTPVATEAIFLLMRHAFEDLGYRRFEWKCDDLNAPSRRAAERFGFRFEGIFRQAVVYKGRNRDTAWYAVIDRDWPTIRDGFERWLSPCNFDGHGRQIARLADYHASGTT